MLPKDPKAFIYHILESIEKIENYTKGLTYERFEKNSMVKDAVLRNLEIIGEASKNIPEEIRYRYSDIPWSEMARLRDRIIHKYFSVDYEIIWDIINNELPVLKRKLKLVISSLG